MKKIFLTLTTLLIFVSGFSQYKKAKVDTIGSYKKTFVFFNRKVRIDSLYTTNLPVKTAPDSVLTIGTGQLAAKTPTVAITSVSFGSGNQGDIFFKQTSTGNFSTSDKFYFDSTNSNLLLGGTGSSHAMLARFGLQADSGTATTVSGTPKRIFNIVDYSYNTGARATWATATAKSSFNYSLYNGKPEWKVIGAGGLNVITADTSGGVTIGNVALSGVSGKLVTAGDFTSGGIITCGSAGYYLGATYIYLAATTVGNNGARSTGAAIDFSVTANNPKAATANAKGGDLYMKTGASQGSGEGNFYIYTSGGGYTSVAGDLAATQKVKVNGVGRLNYTPRNTTQIGADSITTKITMTTSATVSNMGAHNIQMNVLSDKYLTGIMIDTTGATEGDEILLINASDNGSYVSIADTAGSSVLFNSGAGRFTFTPGSNMHLVCQKIYNMTFWAEISRSSVTYRKP